MATNDYEIEVRKDHTGRWQYRIHSGIITTYSGTTYHSREKAVDVAKAKVESLVNAPEWEKVE